MTTKEQDAAPIPGTREVDYADVAVGMRVISNKHEHEIISIKAYAPGPSSSWWRMRARKVLELCSGRDGCMWTWVIYPGDAIICAAEPNTDAVDTQPIAVRGSHAADALHYAWAARKPRTPIVTHRIQACDVAPGMQWADTPGRLVTDEPRPGETWATIDAVTRSREYIRIESGSTGALVPPCAILYIRLPGPSPRTLCCNCSSPTTMDLYPRTADPEHHMVDCPVAPVTGVHGGMRLWPAPFKGRAWREFAYQGLNGWLCDTPTPHSKDTVVFPVHLGYPMSNWSSGHGDMIQQCFFLPPIAAQKPDRRLPGASPDDPDLERVADLVSGGVIGPVLR